MDAVTFITSVASSFGIAAAVSWLSRQWIAQWITQRFAKSLEDYKSAWKIEIEGYKSSWQEEIERHKAEWQSGLEEAKAGWLRELEQDKAGWQGAIHREVEEFLGERSAEREYALEARKRLYRAVGPLKFQLLISCREAASRIEKHGLDHRYSMTMDGYYGRNTLYRLLRPIAIAELIERAMTYADFSIDPTGVDLLRFKRAAIMAFTDGGPILSHPDADWDEERDHLFSGSLSKLVNDFLVQDEDVSNKVRPMYFHELEGCLRGDTRHSRFAPLAQILEDFDVRKNPIFWIRLVCFGFLCSGYLGSAGSAIGFEKRVFEVRGLLSASEDGFTTSNIERYQEVFRSLSNVGL